MCSYSALGSGSTAAAILDALRRRRLSGRNLSASLPPAMSSLLRVFHLELFRSLLRYTSEDFKRLVDELASYPPCVVNGLIFANLDVHAAQAAEFLLDGIRRPRGILGRHMWAAAWRMIRHWFWSYAARAAAPGIPGC